MADLFITIWAYVNPFLAALIELALLGLISAGALYVYRKFKEKGIDLKQMQFAYNGEIDDIIAKVVVYINRKFTEKMKELSPDGKLTDEQIKDLNMRAYNMIKNLLSEDQIKLICERYDSDLYKSIMLMIENVIDSKQYMATFNSPRLSEAGVLEYTELNEMESNDSEE